MPSRCIRPQIVFERQVEARGAGVSLTASAAAELVVDAPCFVPLGGDDVQAPEIHDVIVLGVRLFLERDEDPLVLGTRHAVEVVEMEEVDELLVVDELLLTLRQLLGNLVGQGLLARHELGVAAEQNVRAAARHVGRDRDCSPAACLRDDLGFLRVVFRVEDDVLDAAALQQS
jgi:hypothetical protein